MNPAQIQGREKTNENVKSIICSNLHEDLNKKSILLNHFSLFGEVEGISCSKVNKYAIINFSSNAGAKAARERGSVIDKNYAPVEIYLSAKTAGSGTRIVPGLKPKSRLPSLSDSTKKKYSLDRRQPEAQARTGTKLAMNFLQNNIRAYLNPADAAAKEWKSTRTMGQTVPPKPRPNLDRFRFVRPSAVRAPSPARIEPIDRANEQENPDFEEDDNDDGGISGMKAPVFNIPSSKPFTFKLNEKEKLPIGGPGEEFTTALVKPEPQESQLHMPSTVSTDNELQELLYKRGNTSEDRYRILEARDKLLRMKNPKVKVRVEFAVKLVGTCPDMCPEKERYMREFQRQLKDYECTSATGDAEVDHSKAVKQYSRSSADQEEPLPHELRPTSTLDMTMNYLLHNIVNRSEVPNENLLEWYGFMWDRTRSIRKDITQQQLCDLKAVALMETCTRFHIHCSTRLCELDRHAFDPKLNDENLMKCLQSLEHMYGDLHVKGVQCPNEPEFRSYQILMNLKEGDILWEIQQKPISILRSPAVQHALKIHLALSQNNFVAFFRLVRNSSYMTSCILHRYFFEVRSFALRRLIKAHSSHQAQAAMPASALQKLLGFGPNEGIMLKEFCEAHGIHCNEVNETIMLNKKRVTNPEAPLIHREYFLIESKLNVSVAEAIKGEELGANPLLTYNPHSSFDAQGYLLKSDEIFTKFKLNRRSEKPTITTLRRSPEKQIQVSNASAPFATSTPIPLFGSSAPSPIFGPSSSLGTAASIFGKSSFSDTTASLPSAAPIPTFQITAPTPIFSKPGIFGQTQNTAPGNIFASTGLTTSGSGNTSDLTGFRFATPAIQPPAENQEEKLIQMLAESYKQSMCNTILNKALSQELPLICGDTLSQMKEEKRIDELWLDSEKRISQLWCQQIGCQIVNDQVSSICSFELSQARNLQIVSENVGRQLEANVVQDLINSICSESYKQAKLERENNLRKAAQILSRIRQSIWVQHWKIKANQKKTKRLRMAQKRQSDMENFPPAVTFSLSPASILSSWCMLRISPVKVDKTLTSDRTVSSQQKQDVDERCQQTAKTPTTSADRRESDIENFPPAVSFSLSPATILSSWCMLQESPIRPNKTVNVDVTKTLDMLEALTQTQRRKRSLTPDPGVQPHRKSPRKDHNSILSDIFAFIQVVKEEKESLQQLHT